MRFMAFTIWRLAVVFSSHVWRTKALIFLLISDICEIFKAVQHAVLCRGENAIDGCLWVPTVEV